MPTTTKAPELVGHSELGGHHNGQAMGYWSEPSWPERARTISSDLPPRALRFSRDDSVILQMEKLEHKGISLPKVTHLSSWWQIQVITQVLTPHPSSF